MRQAQWAGSRVDAKALSSCGSTAFDSYRQPHHFPQLLLRLPQVQQPQRVPQLRPRHRRAAASSGSGSLSVGRYELHLKANFETSLSLLARFSCCVAAVRSPMTL